MLLAGMASARHEGVLGGELPPFFLFLEDLAPVSLISISWVCLLAHERSRLYFKGSIPTRSSRLFPAVR